MSNSGASVNSSKTVKYKDRYTIKKPNGKMSTSTLLNSTRELAQELDRQLLTLRDC